MKRWISIQTIGLMAVLILPVVYIYLALQYQIDPFDSSTIMTARLLSQLGYTSTSYSFIHSVIQINAGGWSWQQDTAAFLGSLYGSGMLLAILHLITGAQIVPLSFLPIPYIVIVLGTFLIAKYVWATIKKMNNSAISVIFFTVFCLSLYSELSSELIGRFYGLEYHAEGIAFFTIFVLVFLRGINERNLRKYTPVLILFFAGMLITYQSEPVLIVGGLSAYLIALIISNKLGSRNRKLINQIVYLLIPMVALASLQSFYFELLGAIDFTYIGQRLIDYFSGGFAQTSFQSTFVPSFDTFVYQVIFEKLYSYLMLIVVIAVSATYLLRRTLWKDQSSPSTLFFLYAIIIGSSLTYSVSYFANYGGINFGFIYPWLLQIFLILSIVTILGVMKKYSKTFMLVFMGLLLLVSTVSAVSSTVQLLVESSQGPFATNSNLETSQLLQFVLAKNSSTTYLIGGSIASSAMIYRQLAYYPLGDIQLVVPVTLGGYTKYYDQGGTSKLSQALESNLNSIVLTKFDLKNGLWGDVNSYFNQSIVSGVVSNLNSNADMIYSSNTAYVYSWER